MDLFLADRAVLVTGGASNIGRQIVLGFAAEGARVGLCDVDGDQAWRTAAAALERGAAAVHVAVADLTDPHSADAAIAEVVTVLGGLDVVVNNAGWTRPDLFRETPVERWPMTLAANLLSTMAVTRAALEVMVPAQRGSIVSISSDAAWGEPRQAVYGAAKAGVIAFAKAIAREHGRDGIRSNVVAPGLVLPADEASVGQHSLWRDTAAVFTEEQVESVRRRIPLGRLTTADDVTQMVLFLASEHTARQVTGQVISVSGGYIMPG